MSSQILLGLLALVCVAASMPHAKKPVPQFHENCGQSKYPDAGEVKQSPLVVGGQTARRGEFPWTVSLYTRWGYHFCGGVLLDNWWVVTAAHCVNGKTYKDINIILGNHNWNDVDPPSRTLHTTERFYVHEKFDDYYLENDIAMILMNEPAYFSEDIRPVCAPPTGESFEGKTCTVTGWGIIEEGGAWPDALQYVNVPIVALPECRNNYPDNVFFDHYICAGYPEGGKDACNGDSGGPLVCKNSQGKFELAGLVSWGDGCARPGKPGIYTRVTSFMEFINWHRGVPK